MPTLNRLEIIGNLTRDPELTYVQGGKPVCKFTVAVNRKTKQGDETMYLDVVTWERDAENANLYLRKGAMVYASGRLTIRPYEDKDGIKRKAIQMVATDLQYIDRKIAGDQYDASKASGERAGEPITEDDELPF